MDNNCFTQPPQQMDNNRFTQPLQQMDNNRFTQPQQMDNNRFTQPLQQMDNNRFTQPPQQMDNNRFKQPLQQMDNNRFTQPLQPPHPSPWYYCTQCESLIGRYKPHKTWTCQTIINLQPPHICGHTEWCTIVTSKPYATRRDFINIWNMLRK
jgi:hypothetical protein